MAGHSDSSTVEVLKERLYSLQRRHEEDHQLKEDLQRHLCMVTAELDRVKGLNSTLKQGALKRFPHTPSNKHFCGSEAQCKAA